MEVQRPRVIIAANYPDCDIPLLLTRRSFIAGIVPALGLSWRARLSLAAEPAALFKGQDIFVRIVNRAVSRNWLTLPIGDLMGNIASELEGTPYKSGTLDFSADSEICSADLTAVDCVTFFETTLALARMLKTGGRTTAALLKQIRFLRYRNGTAGDYTSRLHYTSDWFVDNQAKGTVRLLSQLPGAQPFWQKVGFMSRHPASYRQLAAHSELIAKIRHQEETINNRSLKYIPLEKIGEVEPFLRTGDIVGVCTSVPGLDISHTGLVYRDRNNVARFMDASSKKQIMRVTVEPGPISTALDWSKTITGAMFARPLEPRS